MSRLLIAVCLGWALSTVVADTGGGTPSPVLAGPHHNNNDTDHLTTDDEEEEGGGGGGVSDNDNSESASLTFAVPMKNFTKFSGETLRLRCEVRGHPPASEFRWFKNEAPLSEEKGRVRIRTRVSML